MKWIIIFLTLLVVTVAGFLLYSLFIANPAVIEELNNNPSGPRAQKVMLLTLPSGRQLPVNYLKEDDVVYVGADGPWWRELQHGATVSMLIRGDTVAGRAEVVLDDPMFTREVFARLRPTAPAWLPDWLNGKLVVIRLSAAASA